MHALFLLNRSDQFSIALEELSQLGLSHSYILEDELLGTLIGGFLPEKSQTLKSLVYSKIHLLEEAKIDWEAQWAFHAKGFKDGTSIISLDDYGIQGKKIFLHPGPGFGDLSHPTTHLMLTMMPPYMKEKTVVDLGCGSGILSLAALNMGAKEALAIDICDSSLEHTSRNAKENGLSENIFIAKNLESLTPEKDAVLLINMTLFDQKNVLEEYPNLFANFEIIISSGILNYQKDFYLKEISPACILTNTSFQNWLGFVMKNEKALL